MGAMASQITSLIIVYSTVYSGADQRKHQSSASLAFVRGIHWWPVNSPHKWPVMRKCFHLMTSSWYETVIPPNSFEYKDCLFRYRDSHYKGGTVMRPFYLYNGNLYTGKMASLYFEYGFSQWKRTLQCNVVSHWTGPYTEWSPLF